MKLRLGTRASRLAMWQANHVQDLLRQAHPTLEVEILEIHSEGDKDLVSSLTQMNTVGVFTKALEDALLDERVDLAVHSLKDLPAELAHGLTLAAYSKREDPRDAWFARDGKTLANIAEGATVATGSLRRRASAPSAQCDRASGHPEPRQSG